MKTEVNLKLPHTAALPAGRQAQAQAQKERKEI
jgi:hypothetical protein